MIHGPGIKATPIEIPQNLFGKCFACNLGNSIDQIHERVFVHLIAILRSPPATEGVVTNDERLAKVNLFVQRSSPVVAKDGMEKGCAISGVRVVCGKDKVQRTGLHRIMVEAIFQCDQDDIFA